MVEPHELSNKKEAILYSAFQVFTEKGYHQAKVSEIAELARVGKGTVYEYFDSKEALLIGVIKAGTKYYIEQLNESAEQAIDPLGKLRNILFKNVTMLKENQNFRQLINHNFGVNSEQFHLLLQEQRQILFQKIQKILQEAIDQQQIKPIDLEIGVRLVFAHIIAMDPEMGNLAEEQINSMINIFFKGLQER